MTNSDTQTRDTQNNSDTLRPASTALVVVEGSGRTDRRTGDRRLFSIVHPDASFVTQLIATAAQMPQTRGLRRASPEDAQMSYRAAVNTTAAQPALGTHTIRRVA
jgi:hypothetical protein